jgi:hypothetical protein
LGASRPAFLDGAEALFFPALLALGFRVSLVERTCPLAIVIPSGEYSRSFLAGPRPRER